MAVDEVLRETILDALHQHGRAVTYGALAGLVGGGPRNVMRTARQSPQCSWVVSSARGRPTGFPPERIDPRLPESVVKHGLLDRPETLAQWLESVGVEVPTINSRDRS